MKHSYTFLVGAICGVLLAVVTGAIAVTGPMTAKIQAQQAALSTSLMQTHDALELLQKYQARFHTVTIATAFVSDTGALVSLTASDPQPAGISLFHGLLDLTAGPALSNIMVGKIPATRPVVHPLIWYIPADVEPTFQGPNPDAAYITHFDGETREMVGQPHHPQIQQAVSAQAGPLSSTIPLLASPNTFSGSHK